MTQAQVLRQHRREQRLERERAERRENVMALLFLMALLLAFAIAGTVDYQTEQTEIARWQERGVTIQRW